jgi:hypothetical protein
MLEVKCRRENCDKSDKNFNPAEGHQLNIQLNIQL